MNDHHSPRRPPPILTSEPGSFARRTFEVRIPGIVEDTIAAEEFPAEIARALRALRSEVLDGTVQPLRDDAPDNAFWDEQARAFVGRTWLDVPWYWAESFFYRRVLEATRYFQPGPWHGRDPYANVKAGELTPDAGPHALQVLLNELPPSKAESFSTLLHASLWGNRTDLSYNVARHAPGQLEVELERANLLVDDTAAVWQYLSTHPGPVDFLCDNAGTELLFDFALADFLLREELANPVTFHLKPQPFFVSDAMIKDAEAALAALAQSTFRNLQQLAQRLEQARREGRLVLVEHAFSVTCLFYFEMPEDLRSRLSKSRLVISKGDANYRRLLGDAHWAPTTPFVNAVAYFPAPLVALRTLKSELIVGLAPGEPEHRREQDPEWMMNGKRGVIQFRRL